MALAPIDISIGDSSSTAPSLTQQVLPGAHVVLTSDDVAALASRVDDVLRTYRKAFETNSARVDLASTRASSSQSTLDDARAHLHTLEEHASEQRTRLMHRIHALEEQAEEDQTHLCRLVGRQMRLEITMHTLQHAPVDCDPVLWYS